ncbi:MAG: hypothetical protein IJP04_12200 [Clostridia bacterium]|nr:hypothetical protein [Clostridia bacterium]
MEKFTLTGTEYNRIMRACSPALSKDDAREALRYIEIQCNGQGEGCATALDGWIMTQTRFSMQGPRSTFLLPPAKTVRNDCTIEITLTEDEISISDEVETTTRKRANIPYVDHYKIGTGAQDHQKRATIAVNPHILMRALKTHAYMGEPVFLEIYGPYEPIVVHGRYSCGLALPVRMEARKDPQFWKMEDDKK